MAVSGRQLGARLDQAANFFRGGSVTLNLGDHWLSELQLDTLRTLLAKYGLTLGSIRTSSERTFESAVSWEWQPPMTALGTDHKLEAVTADSNLSVQSYFVFRGNLRSGQVLRKTESVVIVGDVNPGGQVVSAGDVWSGDVCAALLTPARRVMPDAIVAALAAGANPATNRGVYWHFYR